MDDEYKESSGHPSNPHPAPVHHPPTVVSQMFSSAAIFGIQPFPRVLRPITPQLITLNRSTFFHCTSAKTDPYYQHQYHNQYHHHHQYHYPPAGTAPPDAGQYGPVNDGNGIQGDETETKLAPKKLPKPPKSAFVLFSEFKHEEREKSGEAICKKVSRSFMRCDILFLLPTPHIASF